MRLRVKISIVVAVAVVLTVLLILNVPYVNGPHFFPWPWRELPVLPVYLGMTLAATPLLLGLLLAPQRRALLIGLAMLSCFGMKLVSAYRTDRLGLDLITVIVENPDATSYYTDAAFASTHPLREWVTLYPQTMSRLNLHSQSKPPGPLIYWWLWIRAMGANDRTALLGGLFLGALATLSIPATYLLLRRLTGNTAAALCGATLLALCPGFVLFFPMFDPAYILLACAFIGTWHWALKDNRIVASVLLGLTIGLTCLMTFNVLAIGAYLAAMVLVVPPERFMGRRLLVALKHATVALLIAGLVLTLLWLSIGYDVFATFTAAWKNQHELLARHAGVRPYPLTAPFDLLDFALGAGWVSVALALMWLVRLNERRHRTLVLIGIGQLVLVAALGLLQSENARVWNFMLPLLMLPAGLELSGWSPRTRLTAYAGMLLVTAAVAQNIKFIY